MYLLSPLIVWATLRWPRFALWTIGSVATSSLDLYVGVSTWVLCLSPPGLDYDDVVYIKFYTRMYAYAFGMACALFSTDKHSARLDSRTGSVLRAAATMLALLTAVSTSKNPLRRSRGSVYLIHFLIIYMYVLLHDPVPLGAVAFVPQWIFPLFLLFFLAVSFALSAIIYILVEKPFINLAAALLRKNREASVQSFPNTVHR